MQISSNYYFPLRNSKYVCSGLCRHEIRGKEILAKFIPKSLSRNKMKIEFGQKSELEHKNNI